MVTSLQGFLIQVSHDNLTFWNVKLLCTDWWLKMFLFRLVYWFRWPEWHIDWIGKPTPRDPLSSEPPDFGPNGPANVQQLPHYHLSWWSTNSWHKCSTQEKWMIPQLCIGITNVWYNTSIEYLPKIWLMFIANVNHTGCSHVSPTLKVAGLYTIFCNNSS